MKTRIKQGYGYAFLFCIIAALLVSLKYSIPDKGVHTGINYLTLLIRSLVFFVILFIPFLLLVRWYYNWKDRNPIIAYSKNKYGRNFNGKVIDLADVFSFEWQLAYIFSGRINRERVSEAIGFEYTDAMDKQNHNLFLFIDGKKVVQKYLFYEARFLFNDDDNEGIYKIIRGDAKYRIKYMQDDKYRLDKLIA